MSSQRQGKLNWLQRNLPEGLLVDAAWLERQGYSSALRSKYVKHGWLQQLVHGLYRRPPATLPAAAGEDVRWEQVVILGRLVFWMSQSLPSPQAKFNFGRS